jgi:stage II sporulation protein D
MLRSRSLRASSLAAPLVALSLLAACAERISTEPSAPQSLGAPSAAVVAPPGHIRIGVVQEAEEVKMGGTGGYTVRDEAGALLLTGAASEASIKTISEAVQVKFWRVQVQCSGNEPYVKDWVLRVAATGLYEPYTEYVAGAKCWRMRVGRFPSSAAALAAQPELHRLGLAPAPSGGAASQVTIFEGVTKYQATIGSAVATSLTPVRVVPEEGSFLTIRGLKYRGVGEVRLNSLGSLAAINELPMEEYLLAVVPRELGPIAFPELEALKAQAVAARTYAYANMGKRKNDGYDLTNTTSDQVYGHVGNEHPLSSQAVTETEGLVDE